ncbi:MAG: ribosome silencing factor [Solirubrobacterales bacterium]|nr:MAG: ribosome silencing factor [Solirubrobacterales bacterium]
MTPERRTTPSREIAPGSEPASERELTAEEIATAVAEYAADRKALEIVQLDLRELIGYTDYFVLCTGRTDRQAKAIHDAIHLGMKAKHGLLPRRVEGLSEGRWILMDYLDVIVHVFIPETREYYRLEQLWGEAPSRAVGVGAA